MIVTVYFLLTKILQAMRNYGYEIVQTLIVNIELDETVKRAMNEINVGEETHVSLLCPFVPCSSSMLNCLLFKIYSLMQIDVNLVVDTNQERDGLLQQIKFFLTATILNEPAIL